MPDRNTLSTNKQSGSGQMSTHCCQNARSCSKLSRDGKISLITFCIQSSREFASRISSSSVKAYVPRMLPVKNCMPRRVPNMKTHIPVLREKRKLRIVIYVRQPRTRRSSVCLRVTNFLTTFWMDSIGFSGSIALSSLILMRG